VQEPYQQAGYAGAPPQGGTSILGKPNAFGAHGSTESPGAGGKAEPPPLEQRPYLGQPFDTNRNPPRTY
jgi:hypothetical protein